MAFVTGVLPGLPLVLSIGGAVLFGPDSFDIPPFWKLGWVLALTFALSLLGLSCSVYELWPAAVSRAPAQGHAGDRAGR
jgi:hypothetical protein